MLGASQHTEAVVVEDARLRELPDGWATTTLGETCLINPRFFTEPVEDDRELTFLPMAAVETGTGRIDLSQTRLLADVRQGYTRFSEGDVLFAKITPSMENGKVAVAKDWHPKACFASYLIRVSFLSDTAPDYVCTFINSRHGRAYIAQVRNQQVGQANVNGTKLAAMPVPLPPLAEQQRIVAELERRLSVIQQADAVVETNLARAERLRQSFLKQAFSGKLVPQDPNDEPAFALLERIRAERAAAQAAI